jgi:hypothetical protein
LPPALAADGIVRTAGNDNAIEQVGKGAQTVDLRADQIPLQHVARHGIVELLVKDLDAVAVVAGDDVAGSGDWAAEHVGVGTPKADARPVAQGHRSAHVGADEVGLHEVVPRVEAGNDNARAIGGNQVAGPRVRSPDGIVGQVLDLHAAATVAEGFGARGVRSDEVAQDHVLRSTLKPNGNTGCRDLDAVAEVARNDVSGSRRRSADTVRRATDQHSAAEHASAVG